MRQPCSELLPATVPPHFTYLDTWRASGLLVLDALSRIRVPLHPQGGLGQIRNRRTPLMDHPSGFPAVGKSTGFIFVSTLQFAQPPQTLIYGWTNRSEGSLAKQLLEWHRDPTSTE